jgi:hypothetical protein
VVKTEDSWPRGPGSKPPMRRFVFGATFNWIKNKWNSGMFQPIECAVVILLRGGGTCSFWPSSLQLVFIGFYWKSATYIFLLMDFLMNFDSRKHITSIVKLWGCGWSDKKLTKISFFNFLFSFWKYIFVY